jgi:hypothetical protein
MNEIFHAKDALKIANENNKIARIINSIQDSIILAANKGKYSFEYRGDILSNPNHKKEIISEFQKRGYKVFDRMITYSIGADIFLEINWENAKG